MEQSKRKYPIGIQTFDRIIKEGFVYVDKTDLVWNLIHYAKFIFLTVRDGLESHCYLPHSILTSWGRSLSFRD